jgi:hypothetical protein
VVKKKKERKNNLFFKPFEDKTINYIMVGTIVGIFMSAIIFVIATYLSIWYWCKVVRRNN